MMKRAGAGAVLMGLVALSSSGDLPAIPAFLRRGEFGRHPVVMKVGTFDRRDECAQSVEFTAGTKRLVMSGNDPSFDCNYPIRFGRLVIYDGRTQQATLTLVAGSEWTGHRPTSEDELSVEPEKNRATWRRPYLLPNGYKVIFSYTVTARSDGTALIEYDLGVTDAVALAQTNRLGVASSLQIAGSVGDTAEYGFGDVAHVQYPRERL